ncbi:STAS domain-containing protein [Litchfieldia salsa]|uniref:Anti-sigma factor antagonist n=1 Tax=Litchfieldia salsa TaxID=930152 RepID=A0A1H0WWA0_9BACI|nr:STAS domain-containing protein [Litchfieldia salsa]SDP95008.1 anti-sigma B factor antagonist [Litchfieldia salsa]
MNSYKKNDIQIYRPENEITIRNLERFKERMNEFLNQQKSRIILDLEEVNYLNSSALGLIADTTMKAKEMNKELVIVEISEELREIFEIVKFHTFIPFFSSVNEAINYFDSKDITE